MFVTVLQNLDQPGRRHAIIFTLYDTGTNPAPRRCLRLRTTEGGLSLMRGIYGFFRTVQFDFLCGVAAVLIASAITDGIKSVFG
jgi:hypothetical protein